MTATVKMLLAGMPGSGKTKRIETLPADKCYVLDLEAGTLSISQEWKEAAGKRVLSVGKAAAHFGLTEFQMSQLLVTWISGPDPSAPAGAPYGSDMYATAVKAMGGKFEDKFPGTEFVVFDSITELSRRSLTFAQVQPEAFSEKTGKPDLRGAYGIHGRQLVAMSQRLQRAPYNVIMSCIITKDKETGMWELAMDGTMAAHALPGIFDEVIILGVFERENGGDPYRAFICNAQNKHGFTFAKDRSGTLETVEPSHLGRLIQKIQTAPQRPISDYDLPEGV